MAKRDITAILASQRELFATGATLPYKFRRDMLKRLYDTVTAHESDISEALAADLGKSHTESFMCEVGMALSEISYMRRHLKRLMKPSRVKTPLAQFPSKSYTLPSPYGCVLIMSPWNYPLLLTLSPLANAIAAGNCAIVKPSAYAPATSSLLAELISETFPANYIAAVTGGREENSALLNEKFDMIFFTGSTAVGREVLRHTAETLTPVVLELGGKSPCIVDESAKIKLAARRIVFGKFLNCGQTCVAPDYVLCDRRIAGELTDSIVAEIKKQYPSALSDPEYGKIINKKHFNRLLGLIDQDKLVYGGESDPDALKIAPTVLAGVSFEDKVMGEEIFGPILPVIAYDSLEEAVRLIKERPKPLALYIFSENKRRTDELTRHISFGGGCINDTIIHLATSEMGFGGVGESGMGSYHGADGFLAFSHKKSIVRKSTKIDLAMRYRPHGGLAKKLIRFFLK